ncbi:MAG: uracil-DNA glycosylase family protein [Rikenellaceae bacterium]|nr:uracil-DNA glycosylase family protein [Rikenellaceae bacterium]MCL2691890.1 uracil-DNA glycosylase family protein [Rikenellaceae bacterium]
MNDKEVLESHPFEPFTPPDARLLMLGTAPPPRARWSMEFYYPNLQNDMWRIFGLAFFGQRDYFLEAGRFSPERIAAFLEERGIALSDTGRRFVRHKGNASDKFLEIVEPVDLRALLARMPSCCVLATTGELAAETIAKITDSTAPRTCEFADFSFAGRELRHYRMPSSSRAYPRPLADKAADYAAMFRSERLL